MEIRGFSGSGASAAAVESRQSRNPANPDSDKQLRIPLPPLETQQSVVAGIEAERALVSANRELAQGNVPSIGVIGVIPVDIVQAAASRMSVKASASI